MKTRIITALILLPILVLLLLSPPIVIATAIAVVSLIALYEFYKATQVLENTGKRLLCALGFAFGIVIPLASYIIPLSLFPVLIYGGMLFIFVVMLIKHKEVKMSDAASVIFSIIYIPYFLTNILFVRGLENGILYIWLIFIGAFLTDTGAYFAGVFLGRHKLCPEISPKKTVEGAIGGVIACIVFYCIYGLIMKNTFTLNISFIKLGILGLIVSVISQIGDLSASIIKRQYGIKDYGNLFPGHGGILDRLDSVIMVSPMVFLFLDKIGILIG